MLTGGRDPFLLSHYIRIPSVALAAVGALSGERRFGRFWAAVLAVALVFALGGHTFVYPFVARFVPGVGLLRYPEKYALVAVLALAALAAEGW